MATPGRRLDESSQTRIVRLTEQRFSRRATMRIVGVARRTVDKYAKGAKR